MVLVVGCLAVLMAPAEGAAPQRQAWWNRFNGPLPAPAPPDVPADGLYVAYSADVDAVAAVAFAVEPGSRPTRLVFELAPTTTPLPALQACQLVPEAVGFTPAQNGPWSQLPRYDCANASAAVVDGNRTTITFDAPAPSADGVLAVALVPKGPGRAAIKKPGSHALEVSETGSQSSPAGDPITPASRSPEDDDVPADLASSGAAAPVVTGSFLPTTSSVEVTTPLSESSEVATPVIDAPVPASRPTATPQPEEIAAGIWGLRKRLGGILGVGLLTAMLLYYSQGHGPLGARLDPISLTLRQERSE